MANQSACACGNSWVFYSCDLATGRIRAVLHPIAADWQETINRAGQGSLTLPTRDVVVRDIWPHLTSIYIARIAGGTATPERPHGQYAALVESFEADDNGTTKVGFKSIESYLSYRHIRGRRTFDDVPQTEICAALVRHARSDGIPLRGLADESQYPRDRTYQWWDYKQIGEAIEQLTDVINGPDWETRHDLIRGSWSSTMIFRDIVGADRGVLIQSDREASGYSLSVDGKDHATYVTGLGAGQESQQIFETVEDPSGVYPRFEAVPSWTDVKRQTTLANHTEGYLQEHRDPVAIPAATLRGLELDPDMVQLGDALGVHTDYGAVTYHGPARVMSISWSLGVGEPDTRKLELSPLERSSESVLNQVAGESGCPVCERGV